MFRLKEPVGPPLWGAPPGLTQRLRAIIKTNFDLRPERQITFVAPVFNGRGPPQLKYEGAHDDLIKIFVLRHYKITPGMKGFKVVMCDSESGSKVTTAASHRVDIGMRTKYTIVSIYNRLFDTSATSLRPTKFVSAGKLQYYCELTKGELPGGQKRELWSRSLSSAFAATCFLRRSVTPTTRRILTLDKVVWSRQLLMLSRQETPVEAAFCSA